MKTYPVTDLTGDNYLNPVGAPYGDGSGTHQRSVSGITSISVHHDAMPRPHDYDSVQRYRAEAAGHYNRLGPGLQYHYKIDNTGEIFRIRPLTTWLYVVGSSENTSCIAICLDGNFENQEPTREQNEALYQLLEELCERHPEFPATWPNVRPHQSYSSTACCGANLRNRIYAIQDKASAQAQLLNQGTYDWPELQPVTPTAPAPTQPTPPPTPPSVMINYRVYSGTTQLGAYTLDTNAWNKFVSMNGTKIIDDTGQDVTQRFKDKFTPAPTLPSQIPNTPDKEADHNFADIKNQLNLIQKLIEGIKSFLESIFRKG